MQSECEGVNSAESDRDRLRERETVIFFCFVSSDGAERSKGTHAIWKYFV